MYVSGAGRGPAAGCHVNIPRVQIDAQDGLGRPQVHLVEKAAAGAPLPERLPLDLVPPGGRPLGVASSSMTWPPRAPPETSGSLSAPESPSKGFVQVEI